MTPLTPPTRRAAALLLLASLASAPVPAPGMAAVPAAPGAGLIHATVTPVDGPPLTGFLRWKDEDAFWDDTFSARQLELPWFAHADRQALLREQRDREFASRGLVARLAWALHHQDEEVELTRSFVCLYGDLAALRMDPDGDAPTKAVMRDGREVAIGNPSRDIDSDLLVYVPGDEPRELDWDEVREITFSPAPAGAVPYAQRLAGTVEYRGGRLAGPLQWDRSECTSLDTIDSDQQDVPMGDLRRLARNRRGGTDATLADGRTLQLDGTNDVDEGNRGIVVGVAGIGRVVVPWSRFVAADVRVEPATGPGYADFAAPAPLRGRVTTADGRTLAGRLVYDLDEAWTCDLLHGDLDECEYQVPLSLVASIAPAGKADPEAIDVTLRDGRRLRLAGDEDTGRGHAGLLVFADGRDKPDYLPWSSVRLVELDR